MLNGPTPSIGFRVIIREASSPNSCQMKVRCQQSPKAFNVVVSSARPGAAYLTLYDIATNPGTTTHLDISPVARRSNHVRDANSAPCVVRPQEVGDERYLWNLTFSADPDAEQLNVQMVRVQYRQLLMLYLRSRATFDGSFDRFQASRLFRPLHQRLALIRNAYQRTLQSMSPLVVLYAVARPSRAIPSPANPVGRVPADGASLPC